MIKKLIELEDIDLNFKDAKLPRQRPSRRRLDQQELRSDIDDILDAVLDVDLDIFLDAVLKFVLEVLVGVVIDDTVEVLWSKNVELRIH